jgi:hypothetical protein
MTAQLSASMRQTAPGTPITVQLAITAATAADDNVGSVFIGVTAANVPPATFAGFIHSDGGTEPDGAYWDTGSEQFGQSFQAGVLSGFGDSYRLSRTQRIDANYAAGRFLWAATFLNNAPAGGDVPLAVSSSHLIV